MPSTDVRGHWAPLATGVASIHKKSAITPGNNDDGIVLLTINRNATIQVARERYGAN